jgi:hypothetical protein
VQFLVIQAAQKVWAAGDGFHDGTRSEFGSLARAYFFPYVFVFYDFRGIAKASFGRDRVCMGTAAAFFFTSGFEVY